MQNSAGNQHKMSGVRIHDFKRALEQDTHRRFRRRRRIAYITIPKR